MYYINIHFFKKQVKIVFYILQRRKLELRKAI